MPKKVGFADTAGVVLIQPSNMEAGRDFNTLESYNIGRQQSTLALESQKQPEGGIASTTFFDCCCCLSTKPEPEIKHVFDVEGQNRQRCFRDDNSSLLELSPGDNSEYSSRRPNSYSNPTQSKGGDEAFNRPVSLDSSDFRSL